MLSCFLFLSLNSLTWELEYITRRHPINLFNSASKTKYVPESAKNHLKISISNEAFHASKTLLKTWPMDFVVAAYCNLFCRSIKQGKNERVFYSHPFFPFFCSCPMCHHPSNGEGENFLSFPSISLSFPLSLFPDRRRKTGNRSRSAPKKHNKELLDRETRCLNVFATFPL